jgi:hypothetical protein
MVNETDEPQRTDFLVEVKVDGEWRIHTSGYSTVEAKTDYLQGFHAWGAEQWSAQWW